MRFLALFLAIIFSAKVFAEESTATHYQGSPSRAELLSRATEIKQVFLDQEKIVFNSEMPVQSFDVEVEHVWAAKRWVDALTLPVQSEEDFISLMWISGQQIAALERQNKIYLQSKASPKWASYVFEKEFESRFKEYCSGKADPQSCLATLKEKAIRLTEVFWTEFKKQTEDDFTKNGLDKKRISFRQIRGHIREAYRNPESNAWKAMNEYTEALKSAGINLVDGVKVDTHSRPKAIPLVPNGHPSPLTLVVDDNNGLEKDVVNLINGLATRLGFQPQIQIIPEERKPWNYVDSKSQNYDLLRASSRYSDQVVRSLGCSYFEESSLLNGQIIARLLRQGSMDLAQLTEKTNRSIESWCYSQYTNAEKIISCKEKLGPLFAELNKYYWQEIKQTLEDKKKNLSSEDIDNFFQQLRSSKAAYDSNHRLGQIHMEINATLKNLEGDWGYQCRSVKDEALGDYRVIKATAEQKAVTDNLLKHLIAHPLRSPPGYCARSVKTAMRAAGIFRTYPSWRRAKQLADGFEDENLNHIHLDEGYELIRLDTLNPGEAPAYSVIVYGGGGDGHVEMKVPTEDLLANGIDKMMGYGQRKINVKDRNFAYVSDYIDSAPRNSPKSRIARGDGSDNGRPVLGIYVIMRKS